MTTTAIQQIILYVLNKIKKSINNNYGKYCINKHKTTQLQGYN